jgi:hypothetical protein
VSPFADGPRNRVALLVKVAINGREADQGRLSSFDHGQPKHGDPEQDEGKGWVDFIGDLGLPTELEGRNNDTGENQKNHRVDGLDGIEGTSSHDWIKVGLKADRERSLKGGSKDAWTRNNEGENLAISTFSILKIVSKR